jgi:hypothetical protein
MPEIRVGEENAAPIGIHYRRDLQMPLKALDLREVQIAARGVAESVAAGPAR